MKVSRTAALGLALAATASVGVLTQTPPNQPGPPPGAGPGQVARPVHHDTSPNLRDLPAVVDERGGERPVHEPRPLRGGPRQGVGRPDGALQESVVGTALPSPSVSFDGVTNVDGVLPPDVNGDVGPDHYVQWVNLSFAIYDKAGNKLYPAGGTAAKGNTLFSGFGGPCEDSNDGDPIALYDEAADRWLMSQFALPNYPSGPFYQCIAISATGNPLGAWHRYSFSFAKMNDYPKFGVWRDGYYMSINQFSEGTGLWAGQGVAVFERDQMLTGGNARMVYFDLFGLDPNLGGMLPSDVDGTPPPAGSPNIFIELDDDAWGYSPDQLQYFAFHADWTNTANASFTRIGALPAASFDSNMCGYNRSCIPQPGNPPRKLDALSDRLMYRLQYRNFGTHETWVVNHTVDANGLDRAGVRWYELRKSDGGPLSIFQQGTFSPDSNHRWMASAAMDSTGNLAIAYNVSSSTINPSIRFTGRQSGDAPNQLTLGETDMMVGSGRQTHSSSRWGDYSMLAVDPVDDCTFWATLEYYAATASSAGWRTRVAAFKLPGCGGPPPPDPTVPAAPVLGAQAVGNAIRLSWNNVANETSYEVYRNGEQLTTLAADKTTYSDRSAAKGVSYDYYVKACNAAGCSPQSNTVNAQR